MRKHETSPSAHRYSAANLSLYLIYSLTRIPVLPAPWDSAERLFLWRVRGRAIPEPAGPPNPVTSRAGPPVRCNRTGLDNALGSAWPVSWQLFPPANYRRGPLPP